MSEGVAPTAGRVATAGRLAGLTIGEAGGVTLTLAVRGGTRAGGSDLVGSGSKRLRSRCRCRSFSARARRFCRYPLRRGDASFNSCVCSPTGPIPSNHVGLLFKGAGLDSRIGVFGCLRSAVCARSFFFCEFKQAGEATRLKSLFSLLTPYLPGESKKFRKVLNSN